MGPFDKRRLDFPPVFLLMVRSELVVLGAYSLLYYRAAVLKKRLVLSARFLHNALKKFMN